MRILLTGCASHLARVTLPLLCEDPRVAQVVGVDLRASGFAHAKYREHRMDVRAPGFAALLADVQVLVHMAFVVLPSRLPGGRERRPLMRAINVDGSAGVFEAARRAGVARIVHLSSAAVYGAWPDNPPLMPENQPLRPSPGFAYAEDKAAVERWLDAFEAQPAAPAVVRLRPHAILGPNAQPLLRFLLRQPFYPALPEPAPLTQFVWEDDVARAVLLAALGEARGPFNLAAGPPLPFRDLQRRLHTRALPLPLAAGRALHALATALGMPGGESAWLGGMRYSLALDCARAERVLDWRPSLDTDACVQRLRARRH